VPLAAPDTHISEIHMPELGRVGIVLQARTGSRRLPGKALLPLAGLPMVVFLLRRLAGPMRMPARLVFATTTLPDDDRLAETAAAEGVEVFRGADADVAGRYVAVARQYRFDTVVRITGDCPFIDAEFLDHCLGVCTAAPPFDLATTKGAFPQGIDCEIYPAALLERLDAEDALSDEQREHVTLVFYDTQAPWRRHLITPPGGAIRTGGVYTVDTAEDYARVQTLAATAGRALALAEERPS
jgi:spore coat polysaccharide biosynthesis protein SpsF